MTNAYYTTNNGYDAIVIPATGQVFLGFKNEDLQCFLTESNPDFGNWIGDNTCDIAESEDAEIAIAEQFGTIIAQRVHGSAKASFSALGDKHDELIALM